MDKEMDLSQTEVERLTEALKNQEFRDLLLDYAQELADPKQRQIYEEEIQQLERERGQSIRWLHPEPVLVVKTRLCQQPDPAKYPLECKVFVNMAQSSHVELAAVNGKRQATTPGAKEQVGWNLPYSLSPLKEDRDHANQFCLVYDCVFHPDTILMGQKNIKFMEMLVMTALEGMEQVQAGWRLDRKFKLPKMKCKGALSQTVIRDPITATDQGTTNTESSLDFVENVMKQQQKKQQAKQKLDGSSLEQSSVLNIVQQESKEEKERPAAAPPKIQVLSENSTESTNSIQDAIDVDPNSTTLEKPLYEVVQRGHIDMQDFIHTRNADTQSARPRELVVRVDLPRVEKRQEIELDVSQMSFQLSVSEKYRLTFALPFPVEDQKGSAQFDMKARRLVVVLPVIPK